MICFIAPVRQPVSQQNVNAGCSFAGIAARSFSKSSRSMKPCRGFDSLHWEVRFGANLPFPLREFEHAPESREVAV
jgi:hypothetical protein